MSVAELPSITTKSQRQTSATFEELAADVAARHGITPARLLGSCREQEVVWPRMLFYYLALQLLGLSIGHLSRKAGHHRTSITNAEKAVLDRMKTEPAFAVSVAAWLKHYKSR
jgi:chromosomal replication initiation ATPase DnaA